MRDNIVTAVYNGTGRYKTAPLYQYDYGQKLKISGVDLPSAYEVHFGNSIHGNATTQIGNADGVAIPDMYLLSGQTVYAWLFVHSGEADGETEFVITIPVLARAKPTDAAPTPVQQSAIDEAIAALNTAVDNADEAVEHYPKIEGGYWYVWDVDSGEWVNTEVHAQGNPGQDGADGQNGAPGVGVPSGGTDGQMLVKDGATDYSTKWTNQPDLSTKADKSNTVLSNSLSMGRKAGSTVGLYSVAIGLNSEANNTLCYAEGLGTIASGLISHAEGSVTIASGSTSHAEGSGTTANGASSHVSGKYNAEDSYSFWPEWVANTSYEVGAKVKKTNGETVIGYICKTANSDSTFTASNWNKDEFMNFAEIIGNGTSSARSNARALTWEGDERLAGDVYVGCNSDSSGGTKLAKVTEIPTVPVTDVQVNGTSVLSNGVANIPLNVVENVSGSTPTITATADVQYVCGECSTLTVILPETGCVDVTFESGSTATVLTVTPPTGFTKEWANGFDDTSLDANTTYEINIRMVGTKCLGVACAWT